MQLSTCNNGVIVMPKGKLGNLFQVEVQHAGKDVHKCILFQIDTDLAVEMISLWGE